MQRVSDETLADMAAPPENEYGTDAFILKLAADLRDSRAALAACEDDYADLVGAAEQARLVVNAAASMESADQNELEALAERLRAVLSSPRARRVLEARDA